MIVSNVKNKNIIESPFKKLQVLLPRRRKVYSRSQEITKPPQKRTTDSYETPTPQYPKRAVYYKVYSRPKTRKTDQQHLFRGVRDPLNGFHTTSSVSTGNNINTNTHYVPLQTREHAWAGMSGMLRFGGARGAFYVPRR